MPPNNKVEDVTQASVALSSWDEYVSKVLDRLVELYTTRIRPLEEKCEFDVLKPSWFAEAIYQRRPFVTFIGPFSSGKSTFINYLLEDSVLATGPQPVTDKFNVVMWGEAIQHLHGRSLIANSNQPFRALAQFGDALQEAFEGTLAPHPILRSVSLVDTPGVLEAAGDMRKRRYEYTKVIRWFVEKSDLVFIMFDPSKLDAGPELRKVFKSSLKNNESKLRIILNKADTVTTQELMRVYGCLFWNLANLVTSTEPPQVYVSSFWEKPYQFGTNHELFSAEKADLLYDLTERIPLQSLDRRVADVIRRGNQVLVHSYACGSIRERMPMCCGVEKAQAEEMAQLGSTFKTVATRHKLAATDFDSPAEYQAFFDRVELMKLPPLSKVEGMLDALRRCINDELPELLRPIHETPVEDPRTRKQAILLQRTYNEQMVREREGLYQSPDPNMPRVQSHTAEAFPAQPYTDAEVLAMLKQMLASQPQAFSPKEGES